MATSSHSPEQRPDPASFALVTGGSSGIGKAIADELAGRGWSLILVAEDAPGLGAAAAEIQSRHGVRVFPIEQDLRKADGPRNVHEQVLAMGHRVDLLVNDAGIGQRGEFFDIPVTRDLELLQLNVVALVQLTKLFGTDMRARGRGWILNLGSIAVFQPGPLLAVYHATKAFVVSLSEALADELEDSPVSITCLCPGPTATNFFARADMLDTNVFQDGKLMDPEEVAKAGVDGLFSGERIVVPGAKNKMLTFTRRLMPIGVQAKMNRRYYEEAEEDVPSELLPH